MDKILTIVIPTYNMEKYLRKCLDSLIIDDKELFGKLEVLVVNDGSKDSSSAIAHEYQDNYPNVFRVIDKENGNYGSCVNRGLKEANGKYIKILDADDTFNAENFKAFILFLCDSSADCVLSDMIKINEKGRIIARNSLNLPAKEMLELPQFGSENIKMLMMHNVCFKTAIFSNLNYIQTEGISYTDQEWIFLPMSACKELIYFPRVVYKYLVGRDGQTIDIRVWEKNFWMEIEGLYKMLDVYRNNIEKAINIDFLEKRLFVRLRIIYYAYFFIFPTSKNNVIMREFDTYLRIYFPVFYDYIGEITPTRLFSYKIVKHWRKDYNPERCSIRMPKAFFRIIRNVWIKVKTALAL